MSFCHAFDAADLVLCGLNKLLSIPARAINILIHLLKVHGLWGGTMWLDVTDKQFGRVIPKKPSFPQIFLQGAEYTQVRFLWKFSTSNLWLLFVHVRGQFN